MHTNQNTPKNQPDKSHLLIDQFTDSRVPRSHVLVRLKQNDVDFRCKEAGECDGSAHRYANTQRSNLDFEVVLCCEVNRT
jgi:hypothetical protein